MYLLSLLLFFNDKCKKASFRMFNNGVYQIKVMMHTLLKCLIFLLYCAVDGGCSESYVEKNELVVFS